VFFQFSAEFSRPVFCIFVEFSPEFSAVIFYFSMYKFVEKDIILKMLRQVCDIYIQADIIFTRTACPSGFLTAKRCPVIWEIIFY
jgi:hypothetical protein